MLIILVVIWSVGIIMSVCNLTNVK